MSKEKLTEEFLEGEPFSEQYPEEDIEIKVTEEPEEDTFVVEGHPKFVNSKQVVGLARWRWDEEYPDIGHRLGDLVILRMADRKMYLAAFAYFFHMRSVNDGYLRRPLQWVLMDMETGIVKSVLACAEHVDFTDASFLRYYSTNMSRPVVCSEEHLRDVYRKLDLVRKKWLEENVFDEGLYNEYLRDIKMMTPDDYRVFYDDLSSPMSGHPLYKSLKVRQFSRLERPLPAEARAEIDASMRRPKV